MYSFNRLESHLFKILITLYNRGEMRIESLVMDLDVTQRSIKNYIKDLNESIKGMGEIVYVDSKKLRLDIYDGSALRTLMNLNRKEDYSFNSKSDRVRYIISRLFNATEILTIDQISEEMNISRSTLTKDLKVAEDELNKRNVFLRKMQGVGIEIDSTEIDKRMMIIDYLYIYSCLDIFQSSFYKSLDLDNWDELSGSMIGEFKKYRYNISGNTYNNFIRYLIVSIYRIKRGISIDNLPKKFEIIEGTDEYNLIDKVCEVVENSGVFSGGYKFSNAEKIFLSIPLIISNAPYEIEESESHYDKSILSLVDDIFDGLFVMTGIRFKNETIRRNLAKHLKFTINRMLFNVYTVNPILDEIKSKYSYSFKLAKLAAQIISNKYNIDMNEDEVGFIAIHFMNYEEYKKDIVNKVKRIALITDEGQGATTLLISKINRIFLNKCEIDIFNTYELSGLKKDGYDIVLTTKDVMGEIDQIYQKKTIRVNLVFDDERLKEKIEDVMYKNISNTLDNIINIDFLAEYLNKDLFVEIKHVDKLKDLFEAIEEKIKKSINTGEDMVSKLIDREELSSTINSNGIMMPHTTESIIDKPYIVIGVGENKKEVIYKNVSLVVMFIFPEKNRYSPALLEKIYDEIIKIGRNKELIKRLSESGDIYEFFNKIYDHNDEILM